MDPVLVRRSFITFHVVLGLGLLAESIRTLLHAMTPENRHSHQHIAVIAAVEAVGAILLLLPRTLRPGALLLVLTIGPAFIVHAMQGAWRPDLAIYTAGAWFVFAHGSAWLPRAPVPSVAA